MKIIIDGILEGLRTRQDGSVSISFATQELDSSMAGNLFQLRGKYCKALYSDSNITKLEEEIIDSTAVVGAGKKKSSSQRLRAVLFILFQQSGLQIEFEDYYRTKMEEIIETFKSNLQ